jgi:hypothetical protein
MVDGSKSNARIANGAAARLRFPDANTVRPTRAFLDPPEGLRRGVPGR